jgi:hypothetical protein
VIPRRTSLQAIIIHHTQTRADASVDAMRAEHMARGWGDIGYHWIHRLGVWHMGRSEKLAGAHAPGWNRRSIAIALVGDYRDEDPPSATLDAVTSHVLELYQRLEPAPVLSHREAMALVGKPSHTDCPGRDWVGIIRASRVRAWSDFNL